VRKVPRERRTIYAASSTRARSVQKREERKTEAARKTTCRQAGSVLDKEKGMEWASNRQPIMTPASAHHFQQPSSRRRLLPCSFLLRHRQRRTRPEKMILALLFTNSDGNILIERCAPLFRSHSSRYRDPHPRDLASPDEI
jgi:hypothetical protein